MGMRCARCTALAAGHYFGGQAGRFECEHVLATEVVHPAGRELPEHNHALAYFCMVVDGRYAEESQGRSLDYSTYEVAFHPAGTPHVDRVGREGGRFLCLEIRPTTRSPAASSQFMSEKSPVASSTVPSASVTS